MNNIELSESLVKELFQNWLPSILRIPVSDQSPYIVRVVCDFWFMDCEKLHSILEKFDYKFDSRQSDIRNYISNAVNNIIKV